MKRYTRTLLASLSSFVAALSLATIAQAAPVKSTTIDLATKSFGDGVKVSGTSTAGDALLASPRYDYAVSATIVGTGNLTPLVPAPIDLGAFLEKVKPGSAALLSGSVLNRSGKLPLAVVFKKTVTGETTAGAVKVAVSLTLSAGIDAAGVATFEVTDVSLKANNAPVTGTIVFQAGSKVTVGNDILGTEGLYTGLIKPTPAVPVVALAPANSGIASIKLDKTGSFTGTAVVAGKSLAFKGAFKNKVSGPIILIKPTVATLNLTIDPATNVVTGAITGAPASSFTAKKAAFTKTVGKVAGVPFTKPGTYNVLIKSPAPVAPQTNASFPVGTSFSQLKIGVDGTVSAITTLSDKTKISSKTFITQDGEINFYLPLYKVKGAATGEVIGVLGVNTAVTPAAVTVSTPLNWIKLADPKAKLFPLGFNITTATTGELYVKPAVGTKVLPSPLVVKIAGGNITPALADATITIDEKNKVTVTVPAANPNKLKVTLNAATGALSGSFSVGTPAKTLTFSGLILPKAAIAGGFFLGSPAKGTAVESGSVALQ